jgi:hypothetical protein
MIIVGLMGVATMVVVMWEKFNQPEYRPFRAGVFVSLVFCSLKFIFYFYLDYILLEMKSPYLPNHVTPATI